MHHFKPQALHAFVKLVALRMGSDEAEAEDVADHLVRANLSGHDSHGVGMLPAYVRLLQAGLLAPNQTLKTVTDHGALLVFDAGRGFGQRMAAEAVRAAMARAKLTGACVLGLRNSAHIGRIGTYGELAAASGMAFVAFVNVADDQPIQAPFACRAPRLGTNPFCAAIPGGEEAPLVLDMATTAIAFGKARVARNMGVPVPDGVLIDAGGRPTTDPAELVGERRGALLSFGLHKGSGLAVMCEMLGAALVGGQRADQPQRGGIINNMTAVVIDLARLGDPVAIGAGVAASAAYIKSSSVAPGFAEILLPGDPERRASARRHVEGIPIDPASWKEIAEAARQVGVTEEEMQRARAGEAPA
jgi:hydroxycarboxylate dehydrogenase B